MSSYIEAKKYETLFSDAKSELEGTHLPALNEIKSLLKTRGAEGLSQEGTAKLLKILTRPNTEIIDYVNMIARDLRKALFSNNLTTMVPIELGSYCSSNCVFCGWKSDNKKIQRLRLSKTGLMDELEYLLSLGFSHIELSGGDDISFMKKDLFEFVRAAKDKIQQFNQEGRLSVCLTPLTERHYSVLAKECGLDTVLTWQESYSEETFCKYVVNGPKRFGIDDEFKVIKGGRGYMDRIVSQERAVRSGLQVGIGAMLGLSKDPLADILSAVGHGKLLLNHYTEIQPLIIGMPIWREIIDEEYDERGGEQSEHQVELANFFDYIASVYLLAFPDKKAWVFPNCRVSKELQINALRNAGMFTSTMVRVGPGAYNLQDLNGAEKFSKSSVSAGDLSAEDVLAGEQFVHYYDTHDNYLYAFKESGFHVVNETEFLKDVPCK